LQTKFSYYKRDIDTWKSEAFALLDEEEDIAKRLLSLIGEMPAIGFETSNHYFYNDRNLVEKILQTQLLKANLQAGKY
jgi:hypothetical protein